MFQACNWDTFNWNLIGTLVSSNQFCQEQGLDRTCDWDTFKKQELQRESLADLIIVGAEGKNSVILPISLENMIPKTRKIFYNKKVYYISTFLPSPTPLTFACLQNLSNENFESFFFFSGKNRILVKTRKIISLLFSRGFAWKTSFD